MIKWFVKRYGPCAWCKQGSETFQNGHVLYSQKGTRTYKFHISCFSSFMKYHMNTASQE